MERGRCGEQGNYPSVEPRASERDCMDQQLLDARPRGRLAADALPRYAQGPRKRACAERLPTSRESSGPRGDGGVGTRTRLRTDRR